MMLLAELSFQEPPGDSSVSKVLTEGPKMQFWNHLTRRSLNIRFSCPVLYPFCTSATDRCLSSSPATHLAITSIMF